MVFHIVSTHIIIIAADIIEPFILLKRKLNMEFMQLVEGHIITEKKKRISQLYLTPKLMIPPLTQVLHFQCRVIDCLPEITSISHTPSGSLILKSLYLYCITSATDIYSIGSKTTNYQISTNWMGKTKVNLKSTHINM